MMRGAQRGTGHFMNASSSEKVILCQSGITWGANVLTHISNPRLMIPINAVYDTTMDVIVLILPV
jgi:hypothetical protein